MNKEDRSPEELELREEIAHILCGRSVCTGRCFDYKGAEFPCQSDKPDQILAKTASFYQDRIEEAKNYTEDLLYAQEGDFIEKKAQAITEAKQEEQERILNFFELHQGASEPIPEQIPTFGGKSKIVYCRRFRLEEKDWQALKDTK